ncbi:MAG: hypothetical protein IAE89_02295 [Anaerolineae bacterium]|nr:hypothetical protein [Anaerolineae bacterium]
MISKRYRWLILFALTISLFRLNEVAAQDAQPRTQYESFDLNTPENAVTTFVDSFHQRDYAGLFLIFAPQTQRAFSSHFSQLKFDRLIHPAYTEALRDALEFGFDHSETEHSPDLSPYLFDQIMLFAEAHEAFLIDLRGNIEILRREEIMIPRYRNAESNDDDDELPAVDVITSVEGIAEEVSFRMVQSPSGRWQVMQVIVPGGDEEVMPWSVSTEILNLPVNTGAFEGVIFVAQNAEQIGLEYAFNEEMTEYWTPTEAQITTLEAGLAPFLQGALSSDPTGAEIWQNLGRYRRQYIGIDLSGLPRQIYANFFCIDFEGWQNAFISVDDGGNCFFQLQYDPESGVFSNLRINGQA